MIAAVVVLVALMAWALRGASTNLEPGGPAPAFEAETFDGEAIGTESVHGKTVVLNFWASWCVECRREAAALEHLWQDYRDRNVVVLGIDWTDTERDARKYVADWHITYPVAADVAGRIGRAYHVTGVPETAIIGPDGRLVPIPSAGGSPLPKLVGPIVEGGQLDEIGMRALLDHLPGANVN